VAFRFKAKSATEKLSQEDFVRKATEIREFREGTQLPILDIWKRFRSSWLERSPRLIFIDLKFPRMMYVMEFWRSLWQTPAAESF
jgi:hypothetical protein